MSHSKQMYIIVIVNIHFYQSDIASIKKNVLETKEMVMKKLQGDDSGKRFPRFSVNI